MCRNEKTLTPQALHLVPGQDVFTERQLLERALSHMGVGLGNDIHSSENLLQITLEQPHLAILARHNIKRQNRAGNTDYFYLIDENPQQIVPGWSPSCGWSYKRKEDKSFDLTTSIYAHLAISNEFRGIVLTPKVSGTGASACDLLPNVRMCKALVEVVGDDAHAAAKVMAAAEDGAHVVSWTDMGLGGIRSMADLFHEFRRGNEELRRLADSHRVFDPDPWPEFILSHEKRFVVEHQQPRTFVQWRSQLAQYKNSLGA